jgi:hypothetical protein
MIRIILTAFEVAAVTVCVAIVALAVYYICWAAWVIHKGKGRNQFGK